MSGYRPQRITRKSARAREMISSIYHIALHQIKGDRNAIAGMYVDLERMGFEWVADEQEWLNAKALNPKEVSVMSIVIGSATHSVEVAAAEVIKGLEGLGYKVIEAEITVMVGDEENSIAHIKVLR